MPHVVITGGPGAGKTSLVRELSTRGYETVEESARQVIAERLARGESPRPDLRTFAEEILQRDRAKHEQAGRSGSWVFFDRGVVEAIAFLHEVAPLPADTLNRLLSRYPVHRVVFVLPPWEAIYATDPERDQTYDEAVSVHAKWSAGMPPGGISCTRFRLGPSRSALTTCSMCWARLMPDPW